MDNERQKEIGKKRLEEIREEVLLDPCTIGIADKLYEAIRLGVLSMKGLGIVLDVAVEASRHGVSCERMCAALSATYPRS